MFRKGKSLLFLAPNSIKNSSFCTTENKEHRDVLIKKIPRPFYILCVFVLLISLSLISFSAWATSSGTVLLEVPGVDIEYGGYNTCEMFAEGAPAFCAEPSKSTPRQMIYQKSEITPLPGSSGYTHPVRSIASTLWFGWGGPGFDPSLWPSTWYDGTPMNGHRYWALEHIILADYYTCNGGSALAGCSNEFRSWALGNVLSYVSESNPYDPNAAQSKLGERAGDIPQKFVDSCYQLSTGPSQTIVSFEPGGWIDLDKDSSIPALSSGNSRYSLENARYGLYGNSLDAENDTNRIQILTTNADGYAKSEYLNRGTYFAKELAPSKGFELDTTIYPVEVSNGTTSRVQQTNVFDVPAHDSGEIEVIKKDSETGESLPCGEASLENALFTITYYDDYYSSVEDALSSGAPTRQWVYKTNSVGKILLNNKNQLVSGETYQSTEGTVILPLGTYLIQETTAPKGYLASNETLLRTVSQQNGFSALGSFSVSHKSNEFEEQIIRGGVTLTKLDKESLEGKPLGSGALDATFEIINESEHPVVVAGTAYNTGETVYRGTSKPNSHGIFTFSTDSDEDGKDSTLPYGTYRIKETSAGKGYLLSTEEIVFSIRENQAVVAIAPDQTFKNQIKRGDLELTKVNGDNMERLAGIPFKITSETTGESHVLLTDENGYASTASSWNNHSKNTNKNDYLIGNKPSLAQKAFNETKNNATKIDTTTNLENNTNVVKALEVNSTASTVSPPDKNGTKNDANSTASTNSSSNKNDSKNKANENPSQNKETLRSQDQNNKTFQNNEPSSEVGIWFGKAPSGSTVPVDDSLGALPFDTYTIEELPCEANKYLSLIKLEGIAIKRESSSLNLGTLEDKENSPLIQTCASDKRDNDRELFASNKECIIDCVSFENLCVGEEYKLKATLFDNTTQTLLSNDPVTLLFTPENKNGSVEVTIPLETLSLTGHSLTVFEELYENDVLLCDHKDPTDGMQTVSVLEPKIMTSASDSRTNEKVVFADETNNISDSVSFWNLAPEKEYILSGSLINKDTNTVISETTKSFTPSSPEGEITVNFTFDGLSLFENNQEPLSLVVFESLSLEGNELVQHADPNDDKQSVELFKPEIKTFAYETETMGKQLSLSKEAQLSDRITYQNFIPGESYDVIGAVVKLDNKENSSFVDVLEGLKVGKYIEQEQLQQLQEFIQQNSTSTSFSTFKPETSEGETIIPFTLNSLEESEKSFVVYEYILKNNRVVAVHQDSEDKNQQFSIETIPPTEAVSSPLSKTGDSPLLPLLIVLLAMSTLGAGFVVYRHTPLVQKTASKKAILAHLGKWQE